MKLYFSNLFHSDFPFPEMEWDNYDDATPYYDEIHNSGHLNNRIENESDDEIVEDLHTQVHENPITDSGIQNDNGNSKSIFPFFNFTFSNFIH